MKLGKKILFLLAILTVAVPTWAQKDNQKTSGQGSSASSLNGSHDKTPVDAGADPNTYVIGATDELNISVWDEDKLSRIVPVRPDGMISLPLLNDIQAAGKTPMQLKDLISEKLKNLDLVKDPRVTVIVTAMNSQRIYVLGYVVRAGAYPILPGMTVLQGISSAGGLAQFANDKGITVLRAENGQQVRIPFNYKEVVRGVKPEQNILLKPGDTIIVP